MVYRRFEIDLRVRVVPVSDLGIRLAGRSADLRTTGRHDSRTETPSLVTSVVRCSQISAWTGDCTSGFEIGESLARSSWFVMDWSRTMSQSLLLVLENMKLCDFGFSKDVHKSKEYLSKTFCGSRAYVSPEILLGLPYDAKKADVWAIGVILYIFLTGVVRRLVLTRFVRRFTLLQMPFKEDKNNQLILKQVCRHRPFTPSHLLFSIKNFICIGQMKTNVNNWLDISFSAFSPTIGRNDRLSIRFLLILGWWYQQHRSLCPVPWRAIAQRLNAKVVHPKYLLLRLRICFRHMNSDSLFRSEKIQQQQRCQ